jgi:hypothetical protein
MRPFQEGRTVQHVPPPLGASMSRASKAKRERHRSRRESQWEGAQPYVKALRDIVAPLRGYDDWMMLKARWVAGEWIEDRQMDVLLVTMFAKADAKDEGVTQQQYIKIMWASRELIEPGTSPEEVLDKWENGHEFIKGLKEVKADRDRQVWPPVI